MKSRQQNIEITPEILDWYAQNFPTPRQGLTTATAAFMDGLDKNPAAEMFPDPLTAHDFLLSTWKQMWRHSPIGWSLRSSMPVLLAYMWRMLHH
jgi:hypothetical protein